MTYNERWFRGLSSEDAEKLKNSLNHSVLADTLREIIAEWERETVIKRVDYDCPSWSHKQAHINGQVETIRKLKKLFDHKEQ